MEKEEYYHFLNKNKIEEIFLDKNMENFQTYSSLIKTLLIKNNEKVFQDNVLSKSIEDEKKETNVLLETKEDFEKTLNEDVILKQFFKYLHVEVNKLNKKYREVTLCQLMSKYLTFILIKNKNLLKKEFKKILVELKEQMKRRDGGDIINIQFKDVNLVIYVHKNHQ